MSLPRVPAVGYVRVKNPDGSLMSNSKGQPSFARMHSPASKIAEAANALRKRKSLKMVREGGGNIETIADEPIENVIDYLTQITEEFINIDYDLAEGQEGAKALVAAVYNDREIGYIRDQMDADSKSWSAFLGKLPTNSSSGSDSTLG